ncbi:hypothetical protein AKJ56_00185 [candidate division MSBL1 archaeon SCGC-AAA382N08]|uniref:DUF218 domain-containing protein n=1 Tax=candidate division MSBL1 archaeon SCGC-AAA382N08 TaxID=1698285 RepID=A0A133VQZ4_9EURY|nr:hypothetical protein AKJ56_00185 [candidate division MSBL1 archaeon SCGC-AAA382N08]
MKRKIEIDVVVGLAFGKRENGLGKSNDKIAEIAWRWSGGEERKSPMILQKEVAQAFPDELEDEIIVISEHQTPGKYLDTFEVVNQAREIMEKKKWVTPVLVCHPSHLWRSLRVFWKMGIGGVVTPSPEELREIPFSESDQIWTRNALFWWIKEIPVITWYKLNGYI